MLFIATLRHFWVHLVFLESFKKLQFNQIQQIAKQPFGGICLTGVFEVLDILKAKTAKFKSENKLMKFLESASGYIT